MRPVKAEGSVDNKTPKISNTVKYLKLLFLPLLLIKFGIKYVYARNIDAPQNPNWNSFSTEGTKNVNSAILPKNGKEKIKFKMLTNANIPMEKYKNEHVKTFTDFSDLEFFVES